MRLLYVEDDLDLAALVALTLRHAGHEVDVTDRVAGLVDRARGVDAVVTDGVLLDGTADDVLAALAADPATAGLPVVICSVRPDAVQHPAIVGRLRKPLTVATLAADLAVALGGTSPSVPPPGAPGGDDGSVRQRGLHELERRALAIGDLGAAVLCGEEVTDRRRDAEREAHQAVGLAGALGEADLAEAAGAAEAILRDPVPLSLELAAQLCELGAQLEDGARERLALADAPGGAIAAPARGRVALVDDDEALVALIRHRLETAGLEVEVHHHGREALEALTDPTATHVDVIVLDVDLPGMNGLSVLSGLQNAGVLRRSRVLLATVHGNEAELAMALAIERVRHLQKPFELDQLVGAVLRDLEEVRV